MTTTSLRAPGAIVRRIVLKGHVRERCSRRNVYWKDFGHEDPAPVARTVPTDGTIRDGELVRGVAYAAAQAVRTVVGDSAIHDGEPAPVQDAATSDARTVVSDGAVQDGERASVSVVDASTGAGRMVISDGTILEGERTRAGDAAANDGSPVLDRHVVNHDVGLSQHVTASPNTKHRTKA